MDVQFCGEVISSKHSVGLLGTYPARWYIPLTALLLAISFFSRFSRLSQYNRQANLDRLLLVEIGNCSSKLSLAARLSKLAWFGGGGGGGGGGPPPQPPPPPPNGQIHRIKYSTTDVLSVAGGLIYIAKSLVIVILFLTTCKTTLQASCEVLHLLECLLER